MFRTRLAVLLLAAGFCGCVTYHYPPPEGPCGYGPIAPAPCGCNGAPPLAFGEGPLLEGYGGPPPVGPPINGHGYPNGLSLQPLMPPLTSPPERLRPQPLAQPIPSPP
jgi:hypothetical protein